VANEVTVSPARACGGDDGVGVEEIGDLQAADCGGAGIDAASMGTALAEGTGDGVIALGLHAVNRGRGGTFFKSASHRKAEPASSGREKDVINARVEFGIKFVGESLDALHSVGADGKGAHLEGPAGTMTEGAQ